MDVGELYDNLVDALYEEAIPCAKNIYRLYGKSASKIYPSYHHVAVEIAFDLERKWDIPEEVIEAILDRNPIATALGRIALFGEEESELDE